MPDVHFVGLTLGSYDVIIEVWLPGTDALLELMTRIGSLPGVRRVEAWQVLKLSKYSYDRGMQPSGPTHDRHRVNKEQVMAEVKTKQTDESVEAFLNGIEDEQKREDSFAVLKLMKQVTKAQPKMWGSSIVGFGSYHYKYASGREGDYMITGFSPRKQNLTLYIMAGFDNYDALLKKLGKYSTGKSCLYIKKLQDVDIGVLKDLVKQSVEHMKKTNPPSAAKQSSRKGKP